MCLNKFQLENWLVMDGCNSTTGFSVVVSVYKLFNTDMNKKIC